MKKDEELKSIVKEKYGTIAESGKKENPSCGCCSKEEFDYTIFSEDYSSLKGYNPDADLGLGCGLPTEYAKIRKGDTVVDLGSGAGNDCFVARSIAGEEGLVIGIDMTEKMIHKARLNAVKLGYLNVEFRLGELENIPVKCNSADVVISNCVLNLVPDKDAALAETYRILKPGGHFSISDMVVKQDLPADLRKEASLYAGCISGALHIDDYINKIKDAGFIEISIQKERKIELPRTLLSTYLSDKELKKYSEGNAGIFSITVYAEKPATAGTCCS
jgi:ubiquinone/menaquinone biosynthesis C-methylase UbiE